MEKSFESSLKIYEIFRDRIKHQDVLISHRVGYFLFMQSAIIYIYASEAMKNPNFKPVLEWALPIMGCTLGFVLLISIYNSFCSIEHCVELYSRFDSSKTHNDQGIKMIALAPKSFEEQTAIALPSLRASSGKHFWGHSIAWLVVLMALILWPAIVFLTYRANGSIELVNGLMGLH